MVLLGTLWNISTPITDDNALVALNYDHGNIAQVAHPEEGIDQSALTPDSLDVAKNTLAMNDEALIQNADTMTIPAVASNSSSSRGKKLAPITTTKLRRSTRANKYDGFHVPQPSDRRPYRSKVKPRVIPAAKASTTVIQGSEEEAGVVPPPTPVPVMQAVGVQLCAIPEAELSAKVLNKPPDGPSSSA